MRAALLAAAAASALVLAACKRTPGSSPASTGAGGCMVLGQGGGSNCASDSQVCTDCLQTECVAEAAACTADPACVVANCVLVNCICFEPIDPRSRSPWGSCEKAFGDAGPVAAASAACLEAHCAAFCRM